MKRNKKIIIDLDGAKTKEQINEAMKTLENQDDTLNTCKSITEIKEKIRDIILNNNDIISIIAGEQDCGNAQELLGKNIFDRTMDETDTIDEKIVLCYDVETDGNYKTIRLHIEAHPNRIYDENHNCNYVDLLSEKLLEELLNNCDKAFRIINMPHVGRNRWYIREIACCVPDVKERFDYNL